MKKNIQNKNLIATVVALLFCLSLIANEKTEKPVTFVYKNYKITGKLILPKSNSKVPVVVWIEGSGPYSPLDPKRTEWYDKNFTEILLQENIGILYYNKRGVGGSEGKWYTLTFLDRAEETNAALDFLKNQPEVDTEKLGVIGHSQGGWIVQIVAALYPEKIKFAVSFSGATFSVKKQIVNDYQSHFVCGEGMDSLKANQKAISKANKLNTYTKLFSAFNQNLKQLKRIMNYEPAEYLKKIKIPILFILCEYDILVYPKWCIDELNKIFANNIPQNFTIQIIPKASHGFAIKPNLCASIKPENVVYSEFMHKFYIDWIKKQINIAN